MAGFLQFLESGISMVRSNPVIAQYAEPVAEAVLTGNGSITIPQGTITVKQTNGAPAKFTWGSAIMALETFLFTDDLNFTVGTTMFDFVPTAPAIPVPPTAA